MLNKKRLSFRIDCMIIIVFAILFTLFLSIYQKQKFDKYYQDLLKTAIENLDPDSLYLSESVRIINNNEETNINRSYLFSNGYIIERYVDNNAKIARKYIDNKIYTYIDGSWYKENVKYDIPNKLDIKYEDIDAVKVMNSFMLFGMDKDPITYVCHIKDDAKDKYLRKDIFLEQKNDLYIMFTCSNKQLSGMSFTQIENDETIDYNATISNVTTDILVNIPEYSIDVDMIEDAYGENAVAKTKEDSEKIQLYNNYQKFLSNITVPAGFNYDEEISTKSEIYLDESDGYGEIIIKGKCDSIIEKLLTNKEYEENSIQYTLEYLFTVETKTGNVDMYRYTENKGDLGKIENYIGLTNLNGEIIELLFEDTKLEFNQDSVSTFVNYIF